MRPNRPLSCDSAELAAADDLVKEAVAVAPRTFSMCGCSMWLSTVVADGGASGSRKGQRSEVADILRSG